MLTWIGVFFGWGVAENGRSGSGGRGVAPSAERPSWRDRSTKVMAARARLASVVAVVVNVAMAPAAGRPLGGLQQFPEYRLAFSAARVTALRIFDPTLDNSRRFHS